MTPHSECLDKAGEPVQASWKTSAAVRARYGVAAICFAGPTASGKSALALTLAERLQGVIVNCDAMQLYADLRILTARPSLEEEARAPHALYGCVDGAENFSAGKYVRAAAQRITDAWHIGALPIIVGGTGLYFRALLEGLSTMPDVPHTVRARVRAQAQEVETTALHARLSTCDGEAAAALRPTDRQRILRALELWEATGKPLAAHQGPRTGAVLRGLPCAKLFLAPDRAKLYGHITARFEAMLHAGALEEVHALCARALDPALPVMRAHGVPHLLAHIQGTLSLEEATRASILDTRHYAKRQFTWARHQMTGFAFVEPEAALEYVERVLRIV